ncbi:hypothetical protein F4805DRAFT_431957 [Annulohypoxylon moriforme]|nr:hypothetical protein F4805DRAFT_431957 [Annulohypoxylon moriforme]
MCRFYLTRLGVTSAALLGRALLRISVRRQTQLVVSKDLFTVYSGMGGMGTQHSQHLAFMEEREILPGLTKIVLTDHPTEFFRIKGAILFPRSSFTTSALHYCN